jgi:hypothetical protein
MTAREFDDLRPCPGVGDSPRPLKPNRLVVSANNRSAWNRRVSGQRARHSVGVRRLRSKTFESSIGRRFVTVGIEQFSGKYVIDPRVPRLCVGLYRAVGSWIEDFRLVAQLIAEAASNLWRIGAHVHQMPNGPTSCNQRNDQTAVRVPYCYHVAVAPVESRADHIGKVVAARRVIVDWQVHRDDVMSCLLQKRRKAFPAPRAMPCAMHQSERRHAESVGTYGPLSLRNNNAPAAGRSSLVQFEPLHHAVADLGPQLRLGPGHAARRRPSESGGQATRGARHCDPRRPRP